MSGIIVSKQAYLKRQFTFLSVATEKINHESVSLD